MPRIKKSTLVLAVFLLTAFAIVLLDAALKWINEDVLVEYHEGDFHVRIVMEGWLFLISKDIILEVTRPGLKVRYPLFVALDFLSDEDPRTYEIDSLKLNSSKDLITISFSDGYSIEYPLFLGAFTRSEFQEKWQKVNCNRADPSTEFEPP